ncbi:MAG TPA: hypothetical protein DEA08_25575 [Planctomycetes bacterium]|nr:hypothetical protein [Planctomycetota bacterium]
MIQAELHGKLGGDARSASERLEDLLTSSVLGTLRYLGPKLGLLPVLERVQAFPHSRDGLPIDLEQVTSVEWHFWPKARRPNGRGYDECDLLLVLGDETGGKNALLVEAKYLSGKSGTGAVEEAGNSRASGDQLARYLLALRDDRFSCIAGTGARPLGIVYLTAHVAPPKTALQESLSELQRHGVGDGLFWLGWRDVDRALHPLRSEAPPRSYAIMDILSLLERKNLRAFRGVRAFEGRLPGSFREPEQRWATRPRLPASWRTGE